jgi:AP-2 complex subunit alpha
MEPWDLNGPEFFNYWKQVPQSAPLEQQSVVKANNTIDMASLSKNLVSLLHVAILKGVDPNINNIVAAGTFTSQTGQIFCLIRLESNPNAMMYRLTLRTPSPPISTALKDVLVTFLQQQ